MLDILPSPQSGEGRGGVFQRVKIPAAERTHQRRLPDRLKTVVGDAAGEGPRVEYGEI